MAKKQAPKPKKWIVQITQNWSGIMFCTSEMVDQKLLAIRTGFFAKVISTNKFTATIQPLNKVQSANGKVQTAAVITNVPIIESARHKISVNELGEASLNWIRSGDTVYCLCGDRDITYSKSGISNTPSNRHHDISDAVIIGLM